MGTASALKFHNAGFAGTDRLPALLKGFTALFAVGSALLAAQLVWEQTIWTWEHGPQEVGLSLVNSDGAVFVLFPLWLGVCFTAAGALTAWSLIHRRRISSTRWLGLSATAVILIVLCLPYGFWQRVFIDRLANSPHATEFVFQAARTGDIKTVELFLARGVALEARSRTGRTAFHAAAANGQLPVLRYLVSRGANVNATDRFGDSPLEVAISRSRYDVTRFLADHGAERIRGDDERRKKAAEALLRESFEEAIVRWGI